MTTLIKINDEWINPEKIIRIIPGVDSSSRIVLAGGAVIGVRMSPDELVESLRQRLSDAPPLGGQRVRRLGR